jgi:hypothetical protein
MMRTMVLYETSQGENSEQTLVLKVENTNTPVYPRKNGVVQNISVLPFLRTKESMTVNRRQSTKSILMISKKRTGVFSCTVTSERREGIRKRAEITGNCIKSPLL